MGLRATNVEIRAGCGTADPATYINLLTWPFLKAKLQQEYGPFYISVTIVLWSFVSAMVILAGAEWSVRRKASVQL